MKTGVYGGTFNPPHIGHVYAALAAAAQLGLDRILIIPTGSRPIRQCRRGRRVPRCALRWRGLPFRAWKTLRCWI
ncbi:MAG: hypothetical protein IJ072_01190 [Oscillospiraceae bacterium]|nr:hypothetical protein [Oscillospiraceae bacterium]